MTKNAIPSTRQTVSQMIQSEPLSAPLTVRDVPAPLTVCDSCGATPALPVSGSDRCPACMRRDMLTDAAAEHLRELLSPLLGLWAGHWEAAGLEAEELADLLWSESGADMLESYARPRRLAALRYLRRKHRPAPYVDTAPERHTVRLSDLPSITERREAESERVYNAAPGLDLLTVELPDGSAALLPLGRGGTLSLEEVRSYAVRIPADLREQTAEVYSPRHKFPAEGKAEGGEA